MITIRELFQTILICLLWASCKNGTDKKYPDFEQKKVVVENILTIKIDEEKINMPETLKSGWHKIQFVNLGNTEHNGQFLLLKNNKSLNDYLEDFSKVIDTGNPRPDYAIRYGGASPTAPKDTLTFYQYFEPGKYALYDLFNLFNGLTKTFIVGEEVNDIKLPNFSFKVELDEYSYKFNKSLTKGTHWLKVKNIGNEPHEMTIGKMAPEKNKNDLIQWAKTFQDIPPVVESPSQGLSSLAPGLESYIKAEFDAGRWVFFSNVTAPDGLRQVEHGMVEIIEIE